MHKLFKGSFHCCCSLQFYNFPVYSFPLGFKVSFGGSSLLCRIYGVGVPYVELEYLTPSRKWSISLWSLLLVDCYLLEFYTSTHLNVVLLPVAVEAVFIHFSGLFHGNFPHSFSLVVFVGGSKFRIFLYHHLELSPSVFLSYCLYISAFIHLASILSMMDQMTVVC